MRILSVPSFDSVQDMIDGFSGFKNFQPELEASPDNSITLDATKEEWAKFQNMENPSHENIQSRLEQLNDLVDCDNKTFQMEAADCSGSCISIALTPTYSAPACSNVD